MTTLFYFTGTGNCLKVARDFARELGDSEIVSIPKVINQELDLSADTIGIIYPVYMFGMPLIVTKFIEKLKPAKDKYIFAVATYGGKAGNSLKQTAGLLKSCGLKLSSGFLVKMPGNYTPLYGALPEEKQNKLFLKETKRIKEIASIVRNKQVHKIERDALLLSGLLSLVYRMASPKIHLLDKDFWANDSCTSCATCVKVCPVNNIELIEGVPRWRHKCEQCFACLHWCPVEAIQYGKNTAGRKRYRNPEIKLQDLLNNP